LQVPLPPPPPSAWGAGQPLTDIERFISLATPLLPPKDPAQLKLVRPFTPRFCEVLTVKFLVFPVPCILKTVRPLSFLCNVSKKCCPAEGKDHHEDLRADTALHASC
jgi:hypothetical protein